MTLRYIMKAEYKPIVIMPDVFKQVIGNVDILMERAIAYLIENRKFLRKPGKGREFIFNIGDENYYPVYVENGDVVRCRYCTQRQVLGLEAYLIYRDIQN